MTTLTEQHNRVVASAVVPVAATLAPEIEERHDYAAPAAGDAAPAKDPRPATPERLEDLAEIIRAYNSVTQNLERSHQALRVQVRNLQEQLASTDAQLQRSRRLAALGEMAAGIAHEVRNPLAAIGLYVGMVAQDIQTALAGMRAKTPGSAANPGGGAGSGGPAAALENASELARKISSAVHGLDAVVGDVLNFARELTPQVDAVPVESLLERALEAQRPALDAAQISAHVRLADAGLAVRADANLLHQALVNMVRNAVQAMAEDRSGECPRRELTLGAESDDGMVVISVRDTGPGIAREDVDRIFNPFFTTRNTGTGLGLAIVHRIADSHGGTISVHNDGGAVFEMRLPAAPQSACPRSGKRKANHTACRSHR